MSELKKVKGLIEETYKLQQQKKQLELEIKKNKKDIQDFFDNHNTQNYKTLSSKSAIAARIRSAYITYNGFNLEQNLRKYNKKELIPIVMDKTYEIVDIKAFVELMKLTHLTPFEIKRHIRVHREVNSAIVKNMFEQGQLSKRDLKDSMDSKIVDSIRIAKRSQ